MQLPLLTANKIQGQLTANELQTGRSESYLDSLANMMSKKANHNRITGRLIPFLFVDFCKARTFTVSKIVQACAI